MERPNYEVRRSSIKTQSTTLINSFTISILETEEATPQSDHTLTKSFYLTGIKGKPYNALNQYQLTFIILIFQQTRTPSVDQKQEKHKTQRREQESPHALSIYVSAHAASFGRLKMPRPWPNKDSMLLLTLPSITQSSHFVITANATHK